jgi:TatA/E family protein of Tat protein translocase
MGALSPWHWVILAVVVVLLFGAKRLPGAAHSLGSSMRIFKSELRELHREEIDLLAGHRPRPLVPSHPVETRPLLTTETSAPFDWHKRVRPRDPVVTGWC